MMRICQVAALALKTKMASRCKVLCLTKNHKGDKLGRAFAMKKTRGLFVSGRNPNTQFSQVVEEDNMLGVKDTKDGRSLGELFSDLSRELSTLVRQEVQLAKTEIGQKVSSVGKNAAFIVAAALLAFVGFQALIAAAILALSQVVEPWLAAIIVGGVLMLIAGVLALKALAGLKKDATPPKHTIETLKEDAQWAKQQIS